uniref:Uncharacterized protein n=1 Tax=Terrapene triunguis TaxID=2587831 RepID=A0A674IH64_9SAUR
FPIKLLLLVKHLTACGFNSKNWDRKMFLIHNRILKMHMIENIVNSIYSINKSLETRNLFLCLHVPLTITLC